MLVNLSRKKKANRSLGKKIRQVRNAQKISQEQLAFECGLSRPYISYLESGLKSPTFETLLSIAEAMNIHVKDLMDFEY